MTAGNNCNQPGIKHAPGVMCIISIPRDKAPETALYNNGRIITIEKQAVNGDYYRCRCNKKIELAPYMSHHQPPIWWCISRQDAPIICFCETSGLFEINRFPIAQEYLIPIGPEGLVVSEFTTAKLPALVPI